MKILALECSAGPASCAVTQDGAVLCESYVRVGLTHSQTLMPMTEAMLRGAGLALSDIDAFAVSAGPGSFTGLRIGVAALKGMAFGLSKPCAGVSTLEAIAYGARGLCGIICAAMDARCNQVYNALFWSDGRELTRLREDRAVLLPELLEDLRGLKKDNLYKNAPVFLAGDGAALCYNTFGEALPGAELVPEEQRFQRAASVGLLAQRAAANGGLVDAAELMPVYLRLPQAERELRAKQGAAQKAE